MKKLLGVILLLSSTLSYGLFGLFSEVVCIENIGQVRGGSVYLPNEEQPFTGKNICKFINGQKKSEGGFKKGKLHGYWKEWYVNGQIKSKGEYVYGWNAEKWTYWYKNGEKKSEVYYKNSKIDKRTDWVKEHGVYIKSTSFPSNTLNNHFSPPR